MSLVGCGTPVCDPRPASPPASIGSRNALCDGSEGRRLAAQFGGSGATVPGATVLTENGYDFLVVDGQCHFWVQRESFGDVREGTLDDAQANELLSTLRLDSWPSLAGRYRSSLCDGPVHHYRFGVHEISIVPACNGQPSDAPVAWIRPAIRELLVRLHATGTAVRSGVRFTLVTNDEAEFGPTSDAFRNAAPWPLASAPAELALSLEQASSMGPGESRAAAVPEAQCLQQIAQSFRDGTIGSRFAGFAPTVSGGRTFRLFVRDSVPFEDAAGLWSVNE